MAYALFAGENYYPAGGMDDLVGVFESVEAARFAFAQADDCDWGHIVDTATFAKVFVWTMVTPGKRDASGFLDQFKIWDWVAP
jgi:hypothetical protein